MKKNKTNDIFKYSFKERLEDIADYVFSSDFALGTLCAGITLVAGTATFVTGAGSYYCFNESSNLEGILCGAFSLAWSGVTIAAGATAYNFFNPNKF